MEKKNTDGLQQELMDSPDLEQFLSQNQEQFVNQVDSYLSAFSSCTTISSPIKT